MRSKVFSISAAQFSVRVRVNMTSCFLGSCAAAVVFLKQNLNNRNMFSRLTFLHAAFI